MIRYFFVDTQLTSFWHWSTIVVLNYNSNTATYYPYSIVLELGGLDYEIEPMTIYRQQEPSELIMAQLNKQNTTEISRDLVLTWLAL